jgi:hypothetical protein
MDRLKLTPEFIERLNAVSGRRSRVVVDHILAHGHITSEELQETYGYEHPPRAVRDVREQGIPIETFFTTSAAGKKIAAYRFGDPAAVRDGSLSGRRVLPKTLKDDLAEACGCRCAICLCAHEERYLQVDHRIPYEVSGDSPSDALSPADYMLVCGSCNRAKSWSCEHCPNWADSHDASVCATCYWADPENYGHIALTDVRRLEVIWSGDEIVAFEKLKERAQAAQADMPDYVKAVLERHLRGRRP